MTTYVSTDQEEEAFSAASKSFPEFGTGYLPLPTSVTRLSSLPNLSSAHSLPLLKPAELTNQHVPEIMLLSKGSKPSRFSYFTIVSLFLFYILSTSASLANKFILGESYLNFPYPLLATALSTLIHFLLSGLILWIHYAPRSSLDSGLASQRHFTWLPLDRSEYLRKVIPCGLAAGCDIGISNTSLRFVTLSLYTLVKSSSPIFSLLFSFIFGIEKPRVFLILIMLVIGVGVLLSTLPSDHPVKPDPLSPVDWSMLKGTLIVLSASLFGGLRWTLTQLLLTRPSKLTSTSTYELASKDAEMPMELAPNHEPDHTVSRGRLYFFSPLLAIYQVSPIISLTCIVLSALFENWSSFSTSVFFVDSSKFGMISLILVAFALLTFGLLLSEFLFISATSVLTLSVAGMFKEILVIALSMLIFGDYLSWLNYLGLGVSLAGIASYQCYRYHSLCSREAPKLLLHNSPPFASKQASIL